MYAKPLMTCLLLFIVLLGTSCTKLQEKQVKLAALCPECEGYLRDSLKSMPGVKLVRYSAPERLLHIKYDTASFSPRRLQRFLAGRGFVREVGDTIRKMPPCCK
jgi:copper chaperone CopZ